MVNSARRAKAWRVRGRFRESENFETPPHPARTFGPHYPLPASGEREKSAHHCHLKPAVMLLLLVGAPTSVTAVVTLKLSNSFCSAISLLCVM